MDNGLRQWHRAHMASFTLDTNCIIDIDEGRPAASCVQTLLSAWRSGDADLALVASSASERQKGGTYLSSFGIFDERGNTLGFEGMPLLLSIGRWDLSFFGQTLSPSPGWVEREAAIYRTLFPNSPFNWPEYAEAKGVDAKDNSTSAWSRWRNQILDAQAVWAHDHADRQVFVTSDRRLWILNGHANFPNMVVRSPEDAVSML